MVRSMESVLADTETVLRAMPESAVEGPAKIEHPRFQASAFDVTFAPSGRQGARYKRRHVVLMGKRQVVHALHTGPAEELGKTAREFETVVKSIREEG